MWASTKPAAASANNHQRTCSSANAARRPAIAAAVIVMGSTDARVSTNHRDTGSMCPGGGLLVRSTWRQLRRSWDHGAASGDVNRSPTSVMREIVTLTPGLRRCRLWQTPRRQFPRQECEESHDTYAANAADDAARAAPGASFGTAPGIARCTDEEARAG